MTEPASKLSNPAASSVVKIEGLSKTFPGTRALTNVSLDIRSGEVHALVGQNGSGKSTLVKILAGYHHADVGGVAWIDGERVDLSSAADEARVRLRFVYQDLGLVLELGAVDNLALRGAYLRGRFRRVRWKEQARNTRALLRRCGVEIDVWRPLSEASPVERVGVAVAAALQGWEAGRGVLVLDEPTAVLPPPEVERLFDIIREVRAGGTSVLYVSHRLDEIFRIADRVSVLREGELVATHDVGSLTATDLADVMIGERVDTAYRADVDSPIGSTVAMEIRELHTRSLHGVSFNLHQGEVLGMVGLIGSGMEEVPYAVAGAYGKHATGAIRVADHPPGWLDVRHAARLGLPLVPADRAGEALVDGFGVRENLSLASLARFRRRGFVDRGKEREITKEWIDRLAIRTADMDVPIATLSGGNQQKVVIARNLLVGSSVLLLAEPTAGVDIGARVAIYDLIAEASSAGVSILVSSSDVGDLLAMCTRILVLRDGALVSEMRGDDLNQAAILHAMEGGN